MDFSEHCISYEQKNYKKGLRGREWQNISSILEVKKYRDKMRIAKSQAALGLAEETKTNSNRFLSYINKKRLEAAVQWGPTGD